MLIGQTDQKECDICHYWYFLNKGSKFQPDVCNGCHIDILYIKGDDYHCIIKEISKIEAIHSM